jgi:serine/threonine protein phosphatase PrpC
LGPIILREAEVHTVPLGPKSVVIVCTDGILNSRYGEFERLATEALLIVEEERENPAEKLVEWAHRSTDNKTALVWKRMT